MIDLLPGALIGVPLLLATVSWLIPARGRAWLSVAGLALVLAGSLTLAGAVLRRGTVRVAMGGWPAPLGIELRADGLAVVFVVASAIVTLGVAWHAVALGGQSASLWPLLFGLQAGLNATCLASDLFNAYVGLEIVGLAAVGLVALGGSHAVRAALRYLIVAVLGSLFFLVATGVVYGATETLDMALAGAAWPDANLPAALPLGLAATGLALKSALFPLHGWLPPAHANAPSPASPLLSALVVKAPLVVLLRFWFGVTGPDAFVGLLLGVLGGAAALWGGLQALLQTALKRVVAYSTVAQIGFLYLIFPLTVDPDIARRHAAVAALVTLAVSHSLAKSSMFLAASTVKAKRGTDDMSTLPGLAHAWPPMLLAMTLAAVSLIGLPISVGFLGKWQLLASAADQRAWWIVVVVIVASLLSASYLLRPIAGSLQQPAEDAEAWPAMPWALALAPLTLSLAAFGLGLSAIWLVDLTAIGWATP